MSKEPTGRNGAPHTRVSGDSVGARARRGSHREGGDSDDGSTTPVNGRNTPPTRRELPGGPPEKRGPDRGGVHRLLFGGRPHRDGDRGGPLLEFAAMFPILLMVAVISIEAFLAFVAAERLESAARAGARAAGSEQLGGAEAAARSALPPWLDEASVTSGVNDSEGFYVEVSYPLPIVFSSVGFDLTLTRRVDMPNV